MRPVILLALSLLAAAPLGAQQKQVVRAGTSIPSRGHAGAMPPAATAPGANVVTPTRPVDPRDDARPGDHRHRPSYIVLGDGTVLADLGWGYEPVLRNCSSPLATAPGGTNRGTVVTGGGGTLQPVPSSGAQPEPYTPPQYIPPVATTETRASAACWTTDVNGRIVVLRP